MGEALVIAGEHFRIAYFATVDPVATVAQYFLDHWKEMGLPTVEDGGPEEMIVSAFHTREGLQRSVVLKRRGEKTIAFAAVRDLWVRAERAGSAAMFVATQNVVWQQDVESKDAGPRTRHRSALVEAGLDAIKEQVIQQLAAARYRTVRNLAFSKDHGRHVTLEHVRGAERVLTYLAEVESSTTAVLQTHVVETNASSSFLDEAGSGSGGAEAN
jgi:hypothetical protein